MLELYHDFGTTFNFNLFHMLFWGKLKLWQLSKLKINVCPLCQVNIFVQHEVLLFVLFQPAEFKRWV